MCERVQWKEDADMTLVDKICEHLNQPKTRKWMEVEDKMKAFLSSFQDRIPELQVNIEFVINSPMSGWKVDLIDESKTYFMIERKP